MTPSDPSFLGVVTAVSGSSVTVKLSESLASGMAIIGGHTYRVGQVGSFVRIPLGYQDLFGVVAEIGASAAPAAPGLNVVYGDRWMRVELAGEAIGNHFERGLSQHPNIDDTVHIVTEADLRRIYGGEDENQVAIGTLSSAENIDVRLSLDALVTRHSAILGSTGSGKSTTVASILRSIVGHGGEAGSPGARILLLDIHGEYAAALGDVAKIFSTTPQPGESSLYVPYWALEAGELLEFVAGGLSDNQLIAFTDKIQDLKSERLEAQPLPGLQPQSLTVDSPVPFSLRRLWYDLIDFETATFIGPQRDQPALVSAGDANTLEPPSYTPHAMGNAGPFLNAAAKGIRRQLNLLRSRLLDRRFDFILHPGPWEPDLAGIAEQDLDTLLADWLGHDKPLTILDLSGVPSAVLVRLIGSILRIVYEALFWSREKTEGGILRPLLVVMEEAHRYISPDAGNVASDVVRRIAKEGRKYGVGAMVVSQRPSEIDETILSQCGTLIALRLSNPADRARVKGALPDNLSGLMDLLPVLRTGEAIIAGEAARLPVRTRVFLPPHEHLPKSSDPEVTSAWKTRRVAEGYDRVVASWRAQRTTAVVHQLAIDRVQIQPDNQEQVPDDA
ncbi:ATP-binding protein [Agrobacterium rhizogenes]|uniref:ATP-binding protein n=1 Tax=Rhizobium rhizogenes TaxID=359 RepID=UPI0015726656|nr:ATP-binding protein [Rhizobium rhizogenes]NTH66573.1 ATP-binding protein [Rhizobium rhizogenes]NTI04695.1 ATP-binding protein [Rhizobium rhizogenes]NTI11504.1 ATP-binding protein [Rhizobium rhizogenes]